MADQDSSDQKKMSPEGLPSSAPTATVFPGDAFAKPEALPFSEPSPPHPKPLTAADKDAAGYLPGTFGGRFRQMFISKECHDAQVYLASLPVVTPERSSAETAWLDLIVPQFFEVKYWWGDAQCHARWDLCDPFMVRFYKAFRDRCRRLGVPIMAFDVLDDDTIFIGHCHFCRNLGPYHWEALDGVGKSIASQRWAGVVYAGEGVWGLQQWRLR